MSRGKERTSFAISTSVENTEAHRQAALTLLRNKEVLLAVYIRKHPEVDPADLCLVSQRTSGGKQIIYVKRKAEVLNYYVHPNHPDHKGAERRKRPILKRKGK